MIAKQAFYKTAFIGFTLALTIASLLPNNELPNPGISDKLEHFIAYCLFALLALPLCKRWSRYLLVAAGLAMYGLLLEGAQGLTGDRTPSMLDALANTCGVLLGVLISYLSLYTSRRLKSGN